MKSVMRAKELNKLLVECNFPSICIHRGMKQEERCERLRCHGCSAAHKSILAHPSITLPVLPAQGVDKCSFCFVHLCPCLLLIQSCCPRSLAVYKAFKEGQKRILVATDLIGRGIDIERVNIVINYDMPETDERHGNGADTYLHRVRCCQHLPPALAPHPPCMHGMPGVGMLFPATATILGVCAHDQGVPWLQQVGRAGRFGTKGLAITFVASEQDSAVLNQVQERFDVDIKPLPDTLDKQLYMNSN